MLLLNNGRKFVRLLTIKVVSRQSEKMIFFSNSSKSTKLSSDLENWMTNLPQKLRTLPVIKLAIPGTHDSFTYNITKDSEMSPDANSVLQSLKFLGPIVTYFMANWSKTQEFAVAEQLKGGIRYFDLRIATKVDSPDFYFVHSLYSIDVLSVFNNIVEFLEQHPQEMVILDCQHFFEFSQEDHEKFMEILTTLFGHKLVPYTTHMDSLTLEYLTTQYRYQVIVIYRSDAARFGQPLFFPSASFPNPWANTDDTPTLIDALNNGIKNRDFSVAFISQCVLTPSISFIVRNLFSTLKEKCAVEFETDRTAWLAQQTPGDGGFNIVIGDFVEMSDSSYIQQVVDLNQKLLEAKKEFTAVDLTPVDK